MQLRHPNGIFEARKQRPSHVWEGRGRDNVLARFGNVSQTARIILTLFHSRSDDLRLSTFSLADQL
jgi:hypothetical protein